MQNEMDFFYHCNEFDYNHDFVEIFKKSEDALLVFVNLDSDVCLYEIDYYKFLLFRMDNFTIYKILTIFNNALVLNCNIITF